MGLTVDPLLVSRFDAGLITEAILGDGSMFIGGVMDHTQHDRLHVLRQLWHWATDAERRERAASGLTEAVREEVARQDLGEALNIVWTALVLAEEGEVTPWVDWLGLSAIVAPPAPAAARLDPRFVSKVLDRLAERSATTPPAPGVA